MKNERQAKIDFDIASCEVFKNNPYKLPMAFMSEVKETQETMEDFNKKYDYLGQHATSKGTIQAFKCSRKKLIQVMDFGDARISLIAMC